VFIINFLRVNVERYALSYTIDKNENNRVVIKRSASSLLTQALLGVTILVVCCVLPCNSKLIVGVAFRIGGVGLGSREYWSQFRYSVSYTNWIGMYAIVCINRLPCHIPTKLLVFHFHPLMSFPHAPIAISSMLVILYPMVEHPSTLLRRHKISSTNRERTHPSIISKVVNNWTPGRCEIAVGGYLGNVFRFIRLFWHGGFLSHMVEKSINRFARMLYKPIG
jgi:hypothetical protein